MVSLSKDLARGTIMWREYRGDALGERDSMYVMFERAIDAKDPDAIWFLNAIPSLRPMRQDPRYQQLLERMGLPKAWRR